MNKTVNSNSKELLTAVRTAESCEIESEGRILGVSATATVLNTEALNKELRITVATVFKAITFGEEYDLSVCRTENTLSIINENITPSTKSVIFANVAECRYAGKKATADIVVSGWILKENELGFLDSEPENVYCRTDKYEVENVVCVDNTKITVTDSNEARLPLKKIMDYNAAVTINNVYPSQGSFQIDGDVTSRLVALSDSGIFITQTFVNPFSAELPCDCVNSDSTIDVYAQAVKSNLTITDGDSRVFVAETDLSFSYAIGEKQEVEGITDCYSKTHDLIVEENVNTVNTCTCFRSIRDKATVYVKSETVIEEILCVTSPCVGDITVTAEDVLKAEGLLTANLIYSDESEVKIVNCEIPFSTTVATDFDCTENFFAEVKVTSLNARIRSATEVEVSAELCITVRGTNSHELRLVSSIEEGAEKIEPEYAISLYIVKPGETVWDVAKALNSDEETVLRLNQLSLPLKGGEKVMVYNELIYNI